MPVLSIHAIAIRVVLAALFGFVLPQNPDNTPLTKDDVRKLHNNLKNSNLRNVPKEEVERRGVDFELDSATAQEFKTSGMDQVLIDAIRRNARITAITVQCQPVECEVAVNNELIGQTVANVLTKSPIKPGWVAIKVNGAPGYGVQTAEVNVLPGQQLKVPAFNLPLLTGELAVTCKSAPVCRVKVKGKNNGFEQSGDTAQQKFSVQGLALGEYEVELNAAPEYFPKKQIVWISTPTRHALDVELTEDPWGSKTPLQVLDAIAGSLGGKEILNDARLSRNTARMQLAGDPPSIGNYPAVQVVETVAPNRLRWELTIAASKWIVNYDGTKTTSTGDKKFRGGEFAQELEHSIRLFSDMRLPLVLSRIREKFDIKKGTNMVLVADSKESGDERYTFQLNPDFSPLKVLHEHLTPPRSREEMEFAQYKSIGQDLKLPYVLILRYPDRPKHEHVFQYDKIDITAPVREEQFKR